MHLHCFEMPLNSLSLQCTSLDRRPNERQQNCNQTNTSSNYLLLNEMRGSFIRLKKSLRIIPQTPKRMCVENAMRLYAHHVCHVQIALFIVTKSNSINTCQRYGVFELNKFILSFIRTFHLALFHFRCPARSHERDTISYKRS